MKELYIIMLLKFVKDVVKINIQAMVKFVTHVQIYIFAWMEL